MPIDKLFGFNYENPFRGWAFYFRVCTCDWIVNDFKGNVCLSQYESSFIVHSLSYCE